MALAEWERTRIFDCSGDNKRAQRAHLQAIIAKSKQKIHQHALPSVVWEQGYLLLLTALSSSHGFNTHDRRKAVV